MQVSIQFSTRFFINRKLCEGAPPIAPTNAYFSIVPRFRENLYKILRLFRKIAKFPLKLSNITQSFHRFFKILQNPASTWLCPYPLLGEPLVSPPLVVLDAPNKFLRVLMQMNDIFRIFSFLFTTFRI